MDPLDEYLTGTFQSDKQDIAELQRYIIEASQALERYPNGLNGVRNCQIG